MGLPAAATGQMSIVHTAWADRRSGDRSTGDTASAGSSGGLLAPGRLEDTVVVDSACQRVEGGRAAEDARLLHGGGGGGHAASVVPG